MTLRQNYSFSKIYSRCFDEDLSECNMELIDETRLRIHSEIKKMRLYLAIVGKGFSEVKAVENHFEINMSTKSIDHLYQDFSDLDSLDEEEVLLLKKLYNKKIKKWAKQFDKIKSSLAFKEKYRKLQKLKKGRDKRRAIYHHIRVYNKRKLAYLNEKISEGTLKEKFTKKYHELIHKLPILTKFSKKTINDETISLSYREIGDGLKTKINVINQFGITFANIFKYKSLMIEIAQEKPKYCKVVKDAYERYLKPMSVSTNRKHFLFLGCSVLIKAPFLCSSIYLKDVADDFFLQREKISLITSHIQDAYYLNDNFDELFENEKQNKVDLLLTPLLLASGPINILSTKVFNFAKNIKVVEASNTGLMKFEKAGGLLLHKNGQHLIKETISFSSYFHKLTGGSYVFRPVHGMTRFFEKLLLKSSMQFSGSIRFLRDIGLSLYLWHTFESIPEKIKTSKRSENTKILIEHDPRFKFFKVLLESRPELEEEILKGALKLKSSFSKYLEISPGLLSNELNYKDQEYYTYILGAPEMRELIGGVYSSFFNRYMKEEFLEANNLSKRDDFAIEMIQRRKVLPLIHEKNILYSIIDLGVLTSKSQDSYFQQYSFVEDFSKLKSVKGIVLRYKNGEISYVKTKILLKKILFAYSYQRELDSLGVDLLDENGRVSVIEELLQEQVDEYINLDL